MRLGNLAAFDEDEISIGISAAVLGIVEVENRCALVDTAGDRGNFRRNRILRNSARFHQAIDCQAKGDPSAGDRGRASTAVGLQNVAIQRDLMLAQLLQVHDRAQAAADQTLDFLRPAALLAFGRFALAAGMRRAREH